MRACLEIRTKLITENTKKLAKMAQAEKYFFSPVIKSNAYGHGALETAKAVQKAGVKRICVVSLEEALLLKNTAREIYILGPYDKKEAGLISACKKFIPVVGSFPDLKALSRAAKKTTPIHLKINTGLNRFGFPAEEVLSVLQYIKRQPRLKLKGLASHLSEGELAGAKKENSALKQIKLFKQISQQVQFSFPNVKMENHILNSRGWTALWSHNKKTDLSLGFRFGMCLYGIKNPIHFFSKNAEKKFKNLDLKPASCLKSFIVQTYTLPKGKAISYGGGFVTKKKSVIAVVSMGYADGLSYHLFKKGEVLFRGQKSRIAGRICMDFFMIDVTKQAVQRKIKKGEEVVIFGSQKNKQISIVEHSDKVQSISEELLTKIGPRVKRIYI